MLSKLKILWQEHRLLTAAFAFAVLGTMFFGVRLVMFTVYWSDPSHRAQPPEAWMTPRYIAHSWDMAPEDVADILGITARTGSRPTLQTIAADRGIPLPEFLAQLQATLEMRTPK